MHACVWPAKLHACLLCASQYIAVTSIHHKFTQHQRSRATNLAVCVPVCVNTIRPHIVHILIVHFSVSWSELKVILF